MLLVADAGNTNITMGIFQGEKLLSCFRMTTKMQRTSDEYGVFILNRGYRGCDYIFGCT